MDIYLVIGFGGIHGAFTEQALAVEAAQATGDATAYVQRIWLTR